jgi:hypothetical protein
MGSIPIRFRQITALRTREPSFVMSSRRPKNFNVPKEARRRSRAVLGTPPATRVLQDRRQKPPKHKKKLTEDNEQ